MNDLEILEGENMDGKDVQSIQVCPVCNKMYTGIKCPNKDHKKYIFLNGIIIKVSKSSKRILDTFKKNTPGSSRWTDQDTIIEFVSQF